MAIHRLFPTLLAVVFVSTACGVAGPGPAGISGTIADTRGGPAVSGATVTIVETGAVTTTASNGSFSFSPVTAGTRTLLATKAGFGASRLQGVGVAGSGTTTVEMLMRPVFDPSKAVSAPEIAVSGLTAGQTVSGTVSFTISVTAANPMLQILVKFGHRGDVPDQTFRDTDSASVTWDTTLRGNGGSFVNIIAYDNNHNVAEWNFPVTVANSGGTVPSAPASVWATAVTFGQTVGTFRTQREAAITRAKISGRDPYSLPLRNGRRLDIRTAPAGATLFVYVIWSPVAGATGYKVYRSFSAGGPFTLLADAGSASAAACAEVGFSGMTQCHRDSGPNLAAGSTVYYRVSAYTTAGESAQSSAAATTPLAVFSYSLTSPADEITTIAPGSTPTSTWTPAALLGSLRYYEGYVWGLTDGLPSHYFCTASPPASESNLYGDPGLCPGAVPMIVPLRASKRYEWDVWFGYAYASDASGDAYSMAGSQALGSFPFVSSGSLNGPFHFTTTP